MLQMMEQDKAWVVKDLNGRLVSGWEAFLLLVGHSPAFWPLAKMLKWSWFSRPGIGVYRIMANNLEALNRFARLILPYQSREIYPPFLMEVIVGFLALYLVFINITNMPNLPFPISDPLAIIKNTLKLDQKWHMFSLPPTHSKWMVVSGRLLDGTDVDVYNFSLKAPSLENPRFEASSYSSNRWRKYYENLLDDTYREYENDRHYAMYLCRAWNEQHPPLQHLLNLQIYAVFETIPLPFSDRGSKKQIFLLREQSCLKESA